MQIMLPDTEIFKSDMDRSEALFFVHEFLARMAAARGSLNAEDVVLEPLSGGRNAAYVLKVTPLSPSSNKASCQKPVVVKIVSHEKGHHEKAVYDEFVRPAVPPHFRTELIDFASADKYSALCYAYVEGSNAELNTISNYIQKSDVGIIDKFLIDVLSSIGDSWYHRDNIRFDPDISNHYFGKYFPDRDQLKKNHCTLSRLSTKYFGLQQRNGRYALDGSSIASPFDALFRTGRSRRYSSCILHGDLNTDNIIVGSDGASTVLIDFHKTGRGHVYEDLVALESSIRINFPGGATFDHIWRQEGEAASRLRPISADPYVAAIQKVRIAAFGQFGDFEEDWTYHFAVAAISLRLMQATDLSEAARARITAAALWGVKAMADASVA